MRISFACAALALCSLPILGCGPGRLPDPSFGSASDDAGETAASVGTGDGDGPGTASTWADSSGEDEAPEDGEGESSATTEPTTTTTTTTTTATTTGPDDSDDDDPDSGDDEPDDGDDDPDGEWGEDADTWGDPPDVTNEPCEPLTQDCFPTHKCVPFATQPDSSLLDANKCMPILGDKKWGEPCTLSSKTEAQDDCDGDGFCWNLEWEQGQWHGTCVPFCLGSPQNLMCPLGWGCLFSGAVSLCTMQCDPLLQDCNPDFGCYWGGNNFQCLLTAAPVTAGHTCEKVGECNPGLACVDKALVPGCVGDDENCCTPWCDVEASDCPGALECAAFFDEGEVPGFLANVGVCIQ